LWPLPLEDVVDSSDRFLFFLVGEELVLVFLLEAMVLVSLSLSKASSVFFVLLDDLRFSFFAVVAVVVVVVVVWRGKVLLWLEVEPVSALSPVRKCRDEHDTDFFFFFFFSFFSFDPNLLLLLLLL